MPVAPCEPCRVALPAVGYQRPGPVGARWVVLWRGPEPRLLVWLGNNEPGRRPAEATERAQRKTSGTCPHRAPVRQPTLREGKEGMNPGHAGEGVAAGVHARVQERRRATPKPSNMRPVPGWLEVTLIARRRFGGAPARRAREDSRRDFMRPARQPPCRPRSTHATRHRAVQPRTRDRGASTTRRAPMSWE
jgi:hypothetical protein